MRSTLLTHIYVSPVAPTGGYSLLGSINEVEIALLLDTGAAVTLLREDAWSRMTSKKPQKLELWSTMTLVSAAGAPLTIHGCACIELMLGGKPFLTEIVVVSPLTSEAILGLDFLQGQQASIDLSSKRLHLKESGCEVSLRDSALAPEPRKKQLVRAVQTVEVPPRSILEVMACLEVGGGGVWLLEEPEGKSLPVIVARALVQPTSMTTSVQILNPGEEPVMVYSGTTLATVESAHRRIVPV